MSALRIEFPMRGATYHADRYAVYHYGVYPPSSVLAGQTKRHFRGSYDTLAQAKAAYPTASYDPTAGSLYEPVHLPEE